MKTIFALLTRLIPILTTITITASPMLAGCLAADATSPPSQYEPPDLTYGTDAAPCDDNDAGVSHDTGEPDPPFEWCTMTRPKTVSPWATDELYDAPGKSWDQTPTKIEPNAGLAAQGWHPGMAPPAQVENHLRAEERAMLRYLSAIEVQNWCIETIADAAAGISAMANPPIARSDDTIWLAGYGYGTALVPAKNKLMRSHNGKRFADAFPLSPPAWFDNQTIQGIAAAPGGYVALALGPARFDDPGILDGPFRFAYVDTDGNAMSPVDVFAQAYGLPGAVAWWPAAGRFVAAAFVGDSASLSDMAFGVASVEPGQPPDVLDVFAGVLATPSVQLPAPRAWVVPAGDRLAVAFRAFDSTGSTWRSVFVVYRYEAGVVIQDSFAIGEPADLPTFSDIVFDETRGVFVAADSAILTTIDGNVWESASLPRTLARIGIKGDILIGLHRPLPMQGPRKLAWSLDHGATWAFDDMPIDVSTDVNAPDVALVNLGNQFAMVATSADDIEIAYSLRLK